MYELVPTVRGDGDSSDDRRKEIKSADPPQVERGTYRQRRSSADRTSAFELRERREILVQITSLVADCWHAMGPRELE